MTRFALGAVLLSLHGAAGVGDFSVSFAPYDGKALLTREANFTRMVAESRRHFQGAEGDDWQVKYAVYGLMDDTYILPMIDAAHAGVRVQVLLEHRQLAHPYVTVWQQFQKAGMNVTSTNRTHLNLTDDERQNLNLIGMDVGGLFHLKTRYFRWKDIKTGEVQEVVISGSLNPEDVSWKWNCETLMEWRDPSVIQQYKGIYSATLHNLPVTNTWSEEARAQVLYSKGLDVTPRQKVFELIRREQRAILLPMFILKDVEDDESLLDALCAAKRRGVYVAGAIAKDMADGDRINDPSTLPLRLWRRCEIPIYKTTIYGEDRVALHEKNAVFVSLGVVVSDTTNWSSSGLGTKGAVPGNGETMLLLRDKLQMLRFVSNFFYIMRRFEYEQACPYVIPNNGTESRENCHGVEPFGQPDWNFLPSADRILQSLGLNASVRWHFELSHPLPAARAECRGAGRTFSVGVGENGQSAFAEVPIFARLACTLLAGEGASFNFTHVADPASQWAVGSDGVASIGRAEDEALEQMVAVARVEVPKIQSTLMV